MKKISTIAITLSALLFLTISAGAQNTGYRNSERRNQVSQNDQYSQRNDQYNTRGNENDQYNRGNENQQYSQHEDQYSRNDRNDRYGQRYERSNNNRFRFSVGFNTRGRRDNDRYYDNDRSCDRDSRSSQRNRY